METLLVYMGTVRRSIMEKREPVAAVVTREQAMEPKYHEFEVVRVSRQYPEDDVVGLDGAIVGESMRNQAGSVGYSVWLYEPGEPRYFPEEYLEPTGRVEARRDLYEIEQLRREPGLGSGEGVPS
jgi:hypothetical protein